MSLLHSKRGLLFSNFAMLLLKEKKGFKKENNSLFLNFRFVFFFFGNSTADCELVIRRVSKCSGALGMDLPIGVKDDAICRNLVYLSPF